MSCAAALLACLAQGAYVEARTLVLRPIEAPPAGFYRPLDLNETRNPYGVLAVGVQLEVRPGLVVMLEARHQSSVATFLDKGQDSASIGARWYPGRRR